MKFDDLPKTIRDKRKINYVLVIISIIFLIAEVMQLGMRSNVVGILLLFLTAFFNTEGKVKMSFSEEDDELQKHRQTEVKDLQSLVCALLSAVLDVAMIVLYMT